MARLPTTRAADRQRFHREDHRAGRAGWLRAAVLGADDGIVSTASLLIGVASSHASRGALMIAGFAGLAAGALSMASGEYVSVSSQADVERADIALERDELAEDPAHERAELAQIYRERGLSGRLADAVAEELMLHSPLESHLRDELGIHPGNEARPMQAALVSAASFTAGSVAPILVAALAPNGVRVPLIAAVALVLLALSGALAGAAGGASKRRAANRVLIGGALAMGVTAIIGRVVGHFV